MTGNCAWFTTDFGTDSLGTTITANVDSSTTNYTVASSAGFLAGDTVYIRLGTAPYDAGEPTYYGYRKIRSIPDGTHITLDGPAGGSMVVASTSTLNRRIIRIHNLVTNASIENLELYNDGNAGAGHVAEAGIYVQGGWNITLSNIRATNPGLGLACFQFCNGCVLKDSYLDSSANLSNANFGRGVTINECEGCAFINNTFKSYQRSAFINESSNLYSYGVGNIFNNSFSDSPRVAITTLGSGTFKMDNTYFLGFQHILYDYVLSTGNVVFTNTQVQTGTPGSMYEQQGINIQPPLLLSSGNYYKRKTFSYKFNLPVNANFAFDSLPKGLILNVNVEVDDTAGITAFYLRRDNSFTNNGVDFKSSLRPGIGVNPSGMGASFAVGNNLASSTLNYNEDKGFFVSTNTNMPAGKTGTVSFDYLELNNSTLVNRYNATSFYDGRTFTGLGNIVYGTSPSFTTSISTPKIITTGTAPTIAAGGTTIIGSTGTVSVAGHDAALQITVNTSGTAPSAIGTIATITFNQSFASAPIIVLCNQLGSDWQYAWEIGSVSTSSFTLRCAQILPSPQTFIINAIVHQ
jgi:hypothetical protein